MRLSWSVSVGDTLDRELFVAFQVLDFALCTVPGAPLKKALIDRGIGKEVYSIYNNDIKQPYFSVVAKGTSADREKEFLETIEGVLQKIVSGGFDKKALLAAINHYEFKYREADFGSFPKGLMYGLDVLESWMYDDTKPFLHLEANETYAGFERQEGGGRVFRRPYRQVFPEKPPWGDGDTAAQGRACRGAGGSTEEGSCGEEGGDVPGGDCGHSPYDGCSGGIP